VKRKKHLNVLLANKDVRRLFIADNISIIGDYFSYVALAGMVKEVTDSNFLVALVYVAFTLPSFFTTPFGGPTVDKFDRKKIIVFISLAQALCAVGFLFASNSRIWIAFAAQIAITCLSSFITPAFGAALPNLTRSDDELRQANALFGSSWGAMVFIGAAAGGFFSQAFGRRATFTADIATFLVCAGLVALIKTPMQQQRTTEHRSRMRPFADMKEAIHYAKSDHTILALLSSKTMFAFGAGTVSQLSVLAIDVFHKGDGGSGMLLAARGFGASIGPFLVMRFVRNNMPRLLKVCGTAGIAYAVLYVATASSPNIWIACLCVMGAHLGGGAQWTLSTYGLQVRVPDHILGRVLAGDMAIAILVMGTSSFAAGILGELLPIRLAIAVIGATSGITAVVFLLATMGIRKRLHSEMQQQSDSTRAYQ